MKKLLIASAIAGLSITAATAAVIKIGPGAVPGATVTTLSSATTDYTIINCNGGIATLASTDEWILDNITFVENGTLVIEAGTCVRGEPRSSTTANDPGALVVTRSARIDAQGTPANPIVFTTAAVDNVAPFGVADGLATTVLNPGASNAFVVKTADQWAPNDIFLDADPKNTPLCPTADFATATPGVSPVVFATNGDGNLTSAIEIDPENRSLWGGVIILGCAPTSIGKIDSTNSVGDTDNGDLASNILDDIFEGFIEGLDISELEERGVYGGLNPNDSSGAFKFVSIRHGGSIIGVANEINGLTLGGVGRGTLIENVEVYCNGDDAFEWFGGTVDTKNLISLWNNDDSFDIDEGFTGRGQFWFSLQGDDTINGDHGGEHDGTDANHDSIDITQFSTTGSSDSGLGVAPAYITVYNATYIGGGEFGNTTTDSGNNRAFRIRDGFNGIYRNSIFTSFYGGDIDGAFNAAPVRDDDSDNTGFFTLQNNMFYGVDSGDSYTVATLLVSGALKPNWNVVSNYPLEIDCALPFIGNVLTEDVYKQRRDGLFVFPGFPGNVDAKFDRRGLCNGGVGFDPRPDTAAAPSVTTDLASYDPTFFTPVSYKGAFSPVATANNIWTGAAGNGGNPAWSVFGASFLDLQ